MTESLKNATSISKRKTIILIKLIFLPLGFAALLYFLTSERLADRLKDANWWLLAGIIIGQVSAFLCAVRLAHMAHAWGRSLSFVAAYRIHLRSMFYFVFVPFSIGADVAKLALLAGCFPQSRKQVFGMVLTDRFIGFMTFLMISLVAFIPLYSVLAETVGIARGYFFAGMILLFMLSIGFLISRMESFGLRSKVASFQTALRNSTSWVAKAAGSSLIMQLCMCTAVFLAAVSLSIPIPWTHVVFVVSSAMLFQFIPVSVGGVGATEVVAVALYMGVGLDHTNAILLASAAFVYKLLSAMIGGILEYVEALRGNHGLAVVKSQP